MFTAMVTIDARSEARVASGDGRQLVFTRYSDDYTVGTDLTVFLGDHNDTTGERIAVVDRLSDLLAEARGRLAAEPVPA